MQKSVDGCSSQKPSTVPHRELAFDLSKSILWFGKGDIAADRDMGTGVMFR
jgi:hypothetical protein